MEEGKKNPSHHLITPLSTNCPSMQTRKPPTRAGSSAEATAGEACGWAGLGWGGRRLSQGWLCLEMWGEPQVGRLAPLNAVMAGQAFPFCPELCKISSRFLNYFLTSHSLGRSVVPHGANE